MRKLSRTAARQLRLLFGLSIFFTRLGDIRGALAVAEQGSVIAQTAKYPAGAVWAECWEGNAHHFLGNQAAAQLHCERGMALAVELGTFNPTSSALISASSRSSFSCPHLVAAWLLRPGA